MKKHDEGYVLAFVMVVIVVLCLVAVSLMSISLNNMEAQSASVQRMQDKYAAMGTVEQVVAALSKSELQKNINFDGSVESQLEDYLTARAGAAVNVTASASSTNTVYTAPLKIVAKPENSSVQIDATIRLTLEIKNNEITQLTIAYESYQISAVGTGEEVVE